MKTEREFPCSYCELNGNCKFFPNLDEIPDNKMATNKIHDNKARAEAIKEFGERLKETKFKHDNDYIIYAEKY